MTPAEELELLRLRKRKAMTQAATTATEKPSGAQPAPEPSGPGAIRSGILGFANGGTMGFADEIGGAIGKLLIPEGVRLTPQARAELGADAPEGRSSYELVRDSMRDEAAQAKELHPRAFTAGDVAGSIALASAGGVAAPGALGASSLPNALASGVGQGALSGVGNSREDTAGAVAMDAAAGGALGAGGAMLGLGLTKAAPLMARGIGRGLKGVAESQAGKALLNGARQLANKKPVSAEAAREALDSGAIKFFGTAKGAMDRLGANRAALGATYGEIIDELGRLGVAGPEAQKLAAQMMARHADELANSGSNKAIANVFRDEADNVLSHADSAGRLGLRQAERIKKALADEAHLDKLQMLGTEEAKGEAASILRKGVEEAIDDAAMKAGPGSDIAELATGFGPVKQRLSRVIEAHKAAVEGVKAGATRTGNGLPGAMEIGGAIQSGNPAVMLAKIPSSMLRSRGASSLAVGADVAGDVSLALSRALRAGAQRPGIRAGMARIPGATAQSLLQAGEPPVIHIKTPMQGDEETERRQALAQALRSR